jgi:hypothetical protein
VPDRVSLTRIAALAMLLSAGRALGQPKPLTLKLTYTIIHGGLKIPVPPATRSMPKLGLSLSGGGARAAGSVGDLKVLAQHSGSAEGAGAIAAAAQRAYDDLAHASTPLIGQVGVDALTARALHLAQREYPWLVDAPESEQTNERFAQVIVNLGRQNPTIATEGTAAVFATLAGLLVTFIGEPLTTGLLRKAWPNAFSDARTKET